MTSKSAGLKLSAVAGSPSVTRLTHKSWTGIKASGTPRAAARNMLKKDIYHDDLQTVLYVKKQVRLIGLPHTTRLHLKV